MKTLVYGAGPLGSLLAARLHQAGEDVSLLARGQRLSELVQHGLALQDMVTGKCSTVQVKVVERLLPEETYDLVAVVMGKHQVAGVLPMLAANPCTPNVLFMGNNAAGPEEMIASLGKQRVLSGFLGAGGTRKEHVIHYAVEVGNRRAHSAVGELDGSASPRIRQIAMTLNRAGFETEISANIDAWLKCHASSILPLGGAYYAAGMDTHVLARRRDVLTVGVRAMREGLRVLHSCGIPILPPRLRIFEWLPEPLLVFMLRRLVQNETFQYAFAHGQGARPELQHLAADFLALAHKTNVPTPALEQVSLWIGPAETPIPAAALQKEVRR